MAKKLNLPIPSLLAIKQVSARVSFCQSWILKKFRKDNSSSPSKLEAHPAGLYRKWINGLMSKLAGGGMANHDWDRTVTVFDLATFESENEYSRHHNEMLKKGAPRIQASIRRDGQKQFKTFKTRSDAEKWARAVSALKDGRGRPRLKPASTGRLMTDNLKEYRLNAIAVIEKITEILGNPDFETQLEDDCNEMQCDKDACSGCPRAVIEYYKERLYQLNHGLDYIDKHGHLPPV